MEMSLQTVVIAALLLIVLIVLVFLFTKQTGIFSHSLSSCEEKGSGYHCADSCGSGEQLYSAGGCPSGQVCCVETSSLEENLGLGQR